MQFTLFCVRCEFAVRDFFMFQLHISHSPARRTMEAQEWVGSAPPRGNHGKGTEGSPVGRSLFTTPRCTLRTSCHSLGDPQDGQPCQGCPTKPFSTPHVELFNFDPPDRGGVSDTVPSPKRHTNFYINQTRGTAESCPPCTIQNRAQGTVESRPPCYIKPNTGDGREQSPPAI